LELKSKDVSLVAIFASIYVVLVYGFAPISFYALQFRVAGVIRPAIAKKCCVCSKSQARNRFSLLSGDVVPYDN